MGRTEARMEALGQMEATAVFQVKGGRALTRVMVNGWKSGDRSNRTCPVDEGHKRRRP